MFAKPSDSVTDIPVRHSWTQTIALHLLPGIPIAAAFFLLGAVMQDNPGWIALYSLTIVAVLVEFPLLILLTRILIARERARGQLPADTKAIPYRRRQPLWMWLVATGLILVVAVLNMAATPPLTAPFAGLQAQMPDWAVLAFEPRVFARAIGASPELFWFMWLASLPALMLAGGIAQEVYFRGYLLPRMPRAGLATPLINAGLFSVFHLTSPWAIVARLPYVVVFSLMAWWRKSLNLAIWIHAGMGILLFLMGTAFLLIGIARSAG